MNIYVETNFVLELAFQQEQCASCEQILELCNVGLAKLIIPAYSLAEPHEKLSRQAKGRREIQQLLDGELRQLSRTASYQSRIRSVQDIASLLVQSNEEERQRFITYRERLLNIGEIIPLTVEILSEAALYEAPYDLRSQDALIYASVISHLRQYQPQSACFLNRNSKDFDSPDIVDELQRFSCRMIPRFDHGYNFLKSNLLA
ncbi:PIN domain-containing protein [Phormidesmis priestleyi ULC007]|uniref:PIN domain-containing protein n=1 Tax=Phormidesmis priestleyi ULC007 TaxID=1920490 RepID=A0A2T1DE67_9CYAN|nr:PIN domain-containing protein [Phormidesmis priestleyi]PSB18731.1 PIN domain-containing protein [Phormidesmis priestleyi ULC007]PZO51509.1 MAG: PIN domain-containing protein [Phormidesmis priestleyi]